MSKQAETAALYGAIHARAGDTQFLGYEGTEAQGRVVAIVRDGIEFDELTGQGEAEVVLDRTPSTPRAAARSATAASSARPAAGRRCSP